MSLVNRDLRSEAIRRINRGIELARFKQTEARTIPGFAAMPCANRILVTGGTGCIGTRLLELLATYGDAELFCLSRGNRMDHRIRPSVRYLLGDVRDESRMNEVMRNVRPELVFHLAAQRDPGFAETSVQETISTNLIGTAVTVRAAAAIGANQFVAASSGKALRYFTSGVYAASKSLSEYLVASTGRRYGIATTSARFTHVVDNSILFNRLAAWTKAEAAVRLHGDDLYFYVQSALECAQLLIATTDLVDKKNNYLVALRELGWPVSLVDLALDVIDEGGGKSPVRFVGFEPGYIDEDCSFLYDVRTAGDTSPLLNAVEAFAARPLERVNAIDFAAALEPSNSLDRAISNYEKRFLCQGSENLRSGLDELSAELCRHRFRTGDPEVISRLRVRAAYAGGTPDEKIVSQALFSLTV